MDYLFTPSQSCSSQSEVRFCLPKGTNNPSGWLTDILGRISDHKINKIDELMPWRYAPPC